MYRIAICDDEPYYVKIIENILKEILKNKNIEYLIYGCHSGKEFLNSKHIFDLVFMDLELKNENGFNIIKKCKNRNTLFVILTSHDEEIERGYLVRAFRFLIKPINENKMQEAVNSALKLYKDKKKISVYNEKKDIFVVDIDAIYYIEAGVKCTYIRTYDGFYQCKIKIGDIMKELSNDFYLVHRSYIVNFKYVSRIERYEIEMQNKEKVKLSRLKYDDFRKKYFDFIRGNAYA